MNYFANGPLILHYHKSSLFLKKKCYHLNSDKHFLTLAPKSGLEIYVSLQNITNHSISETHGSCLESLRMSCRIQGQLWGYGGLHIGH